MCLIENNKWLGNNRLLFLVIVNDPVKNVSFHQIISAFSIVSWLSLKRMQDLPTTKGVLGDLPLEPFDNGFF